MLVRASANGEARAAKPEKVSCLSVGNGRSLATVQRPPETLVHTRTPTRTYARGQIVFGFRSTKVVRPSKAEHAESRSRSRDRYRTSAVARTGVQTGARCTRMYMYMCTCVHVVHVSRTEALLRSWHVRGARITSRHLIGLRLGLWLPSQLVQDEVAQHICEESHVAHAQRTQTHVWVRGD